MTTTAAAQVTETKEISSRHWVFTTLGGIALLFAIHVFIAYRMDIFGILRDTHGRALATRGDERAAKYLLNYAYVPNNFDALIVGASVSCNWVGDDLTGYHFYNESVLGGNASEERRLVEQALPHGHFKVAVVLLHPWMTASHNLLDGFLKVNRAEVLGSIPSLSIEYEIFANKPIPALPDGGRRLVAAYVPHRYDETGPLSDFSQDPEAVADYRALVQELLARGTHVVYVVDPLYEGYYLHNREGLARYMQTVAETMPRAPIIDFDAPEYAFFRKDGSNFFDYNHLTSAGADTLSRMLNVRLHKILHDQ